MSLKQTKHLYRELTSFRFISNFKSIRKPGACECSDERCKINVNETNIFTMTNGQACEIHKEIDWPSVNVIYYLKCKICNEKETMGEYERI